jgi:uncharacterized protein YlxW (UPF0749 family)
VQSAFASTDPAHPGLLAEIMTNTLDQDYQVAADRAAVRHAPARSGGRTALLVVLAVFGAMLGISAIRTEQDRPAAAAERDQLVAEIHQRQAHLDALHQQLGTLETSVASLQSAAGHDRAVSRQLEADLAQVSGTSGVAPVSGPGVRVTADDAPGAERSANGVILDTDLQALVNALWESGAEAVAINGHRLTSLSAIRFAGQAITVDYRSLTPPYVIDAIGDPNTLPAKLLETPGGQAWLALQQNFGIRFATTTSADLTLPGDSGAQVREAAPVGAR